MAEQTEQLPKTDTDARVRRRHQLIEATISAIALYGLSNTTVAKVAELADMATGTVNFHFTTKDQLLLATLELLATEFETAIESAIASAGTDPGEGLLAAIDVYVSSQHSDQRKIAVWYAFMGETGSRNEYLRLCSDMDEAYLNAFVHLCEQIIQDAGKEQALDAYAIAAAIMGLLETLWMEFLTSPDIAKSRIKGRETCLAFLASIFPWKFAMPPARRPQKINNDHLSDQAMVVNQETNLTLPAWVYSNEEFFKIEKDDIFMPSWQFVCHISDIANIGDYFTFNLLNERAFVVRGKDKQIRAFHNVCKHRAHAVVEGESGNCPHAITCPYHGWTYDFSGTLTKAAYEKTFPKIEAGVEIGLTPLDVELWQGFIFVRFKKTGPSVAERMQNYDAEIAPYQLANLQPLGDFRFMSINSNWKTIIDNYLEDYHFANDERFYALMSREFEHEVLVGGVSRLSHVMQAQPSKSYWTESRYANILPRYDHLPEHLQKRWTSYTLFPNTVLDFYPELVMVNQILPVSANQSIIRTRHYGLADDRRETKLVRYLNRRINRDYDLHNLPLAVSVQEGIHSSSFVTGYLSERDIGVRGLQNWIRQQIPVARVVTPPRAESVAFLNRELSKR
jgi:phenylpropionate dioxygenase-like ring-hydroxylating dioxygenase large terminal subunit/AcrR family transcriptional regulator